MKLRSQLAVLSLAALLPLAILAVVFGAFLIKEQRDAFRRGTEDRARALITAVDSELNGSIDVLRALANAHSIDEQDLTRFRRTAMALLEKQTNWTTINLALPDGRQILNTRIPAGAPLPRISAQDDSLVRVAQTSKPVVADMVFGPSSRRWDFAVRVPVVRDGRLVYILSAVIEPESMGELMRAQGLPRDWEGTVLDRKGRVVSRTTERGRIGDYASARLVKALAESPGQWYREVNDDGVARYRAYRRSESTGWTFAMAIPARFVDRTATRAVWIFGLALAGTIFLALALAHLVGRKIAAPITALAAATDRLARGEKIEVKQGTRLTELRALEHALTNAASVQVALQRAEERLRLALRGAQMGAWEFDLDTNENIWGEGMAEILGVGPEEAAEASRHWLDFVHPEDRERVASEFRSACDEGRPNWNMDIRMVRRDGELRWFNTRGKLTCAPGTHRVMIGLAQDITDRRRTEQALHDADRHKDEFLAMLSHELRNPLAALSTAAYVLRAAAPNDSAMAEVQRVVERQTQHMVRLIEDLLDISRVRLGKLSLKREPVNLAQVVSEVTHSKRAAGAFDARASVSLEASDAWVDGDRARLEQVYANLLDNALKFTPATGAIRVRVRKSAGEAVLSVSDDGCGIPAEMLRSVFELFVQGEQSLDRAQGGLGLGLALVRRLAELHGGRVQAVSEGLGRGATFTVALPAIEAPANVAGPGTPAASPGPKPLRVLVVEDNHDTRRMLHTALSMQGYDVREAADGAGGVSAAAQMNPDVVLLDIGLPDMDGYEVARRMRSAPGGRASVLVAVSGYGGEDDRGRARDAGFDAHLVKPVLPERLRQIMSELATARHRGATR